MMELKVLIVWWHICASASVKNFLEYSRTGLLRDQPLSTALVLSFLFFFSLFFFFSFFLLLKCIIPRFQWPYKRPFSIYKKGGHLKVILCTMDPDSTCRMYNKQSIKSPWMLLLCCLSTKLSVHCIIWSTSDSDYRQCRRSQQSFKCFAVKFLRPSKYKYFCVGIMPWTSN